MKKLSHSEFAFLLQLSIQELIVFGTPKSLALLQEMLLELNGDNFYPQLFGQVARSAELYNKALVVEECFGFQSLRVVAQCPRCNQIFTMDGTRESEMDHKVCRQYTVCPFCYQQFDFDCWPIHALRNVPAELASVLVGKE